MPRGESRSSILLSREENEQIFAMMGGKCQSLATAVVQLFVTEGPAHSEWKKLDTGVLCLVKDNGRRSYFFRLYCLHRRCMVWEHEVYIQIEYKSPRPYLHTFEAEEYMTAFNFANEEEARALRDILLEKIRMRKKRREERHQQRLSMASARGGQATGPAEPAPRQNGAPPPPAATLDVSKPIGNSKSRKKDKNRRFTKADISAPKDFVHVSHIGWDEQKGFDVENVTENEMKDFFRMAGISETYLHEQDTREFIYDFIDKHGGLTAFKEEVQSGHDTAHQTKSTNNHFKGSRAPAPPPVPTRSPAAVPGPPSRAPPAPPARAVPPPPHPAPSSAPAPPRNPPPPRPSQPPTSGPPAMPPPPPPPPIAGAPHPPPPPPPPPSDSAPPPPPPPPGLPTPTQADPRTELMNSIKSGAALKPVHTSSRPAPVEDGRNDLLRQIREGTKLKHVERDDTGEPARSQNGPRLTDQLTDALWRRFEAIQGSESENDSTSSDGEWAD